MKLRTLISRLNDIGFLRVSQKGSHAKYRHANGRSLIVYSYQRDQDIKQVVALDLIATALARSR
jgi:predicted RNA binding protein YcfA (HicA-like mRNA interferase family)